MWKTFKPFCKAFIMMLSSSKCSIDVSTHYPLCLQSICSHGNGFYLYLPLYIVFKVVLQIFVSHFRDEAGSQLCEFCQMYQIGWLNWVSNTTWFLILHSNSLIIHILNSWCIHITQFLGASEENTVFFISASSSLSRLHPGWYAEGLLE